MPYMGVIWHGEHESGVYLVTFQFTSASFLRMGPPGTLFWGRGPFTRTIFQKNFPQRPPNFFYPKVSQHIWGVPLRAGFFISALKVTALEWPKKFGHFFWSILNFLQFSRVFLGSKGWIFWAKKLAKTWEKTNKYMASQVVFMDMAQKMPFR